jgi:hypothetical protein
VAVFSQGGPAVSDVERCEELFRELAASIIWKGRVSHRLGKKPYGWTTDELEYGSYSNSPAGPFDWIRTIARTSDPLYVYLRPEAKQHSIGMMHRIDFRAKSSPEALARWHQKITQKKDADLTTGD